MGLFLTGVWLIAYGVITLFIDTAPHTGSAVLLGVLAFIAGIVVVIESGLPYVRR